MLWFRPCGDTSRAMSRENVELLRLGYEAFNRGDFEGWLGALDPDVELDERYIAPDAAVYRGHDGVRRWLPEGSEAIGSPSFEVFAGSLVATRW
jgi:ketosteroid isomerase-like protein